MMGLRWAILMGQQMKGGQAMQQLAQTAQAASQGGWLSEVSRRRRKGGSAATGNAGKTLLGGSNG